MKRIGSFGTVAPGLGRVIRIVQSRADELADRCPRRDRCAASRDTAGSVVGIEAPQTVERLRQQRVAAEIRNHV